MASLPSLDWYEIAILVASAPLLVFAYVVYPVQFVQIAVWLLIFTMYVGWMAVALKEWVFDESEAS
jgi:hypothetical protein